jgi:hypothetical protein
VCLGIFPESRRNISFCLGARLESQTGAHNITMTNILHELFMSGHQYTDTCSVAYKNECLFTGDDLGST